MSSKVVCHVHKVDIDGYDSTGRYFGVTLRGAPKLYYYREETTEGTFFGYVRARTRADALFTARAMPEHWSIVRDE